MKLHDAAFYLSAFFIIGIGAASLNINLWLFLFSTPFIVWYLLKSKYAGGLLLKWACLLFITAFIGYFYYNFHTALNKDYLILDESITFQGAVYKEPFHGLDSQAVDIRLKPPYKGNVRIYTSLYPEYHYGDFIEVDGKIIKSDSSNLNISLSPKVNLVSSNNGSSSKVFLFSFKSKLVGNLGRILPGEQSAFMVGILFGERSGFSKEFTEALQESGTTHLVALSGYNISIIAVALATLLSYFFKRSRAFWLTVFFIITFVLMTGGEESVVRAAIMGIIFLIFERSSRLYSLRNAITLTAAIMLLFNPELLVFSVGFQLSFAALLGIIYLRPLIEKVTKFKGGGSFLGWRENLLQTTSAQLATLPILITTFGRFSFSGILANVLLLEFMPLTMFLGFMGALTGLFSYHLSLIIGWVTNILLSYEIFIINLFGSYLT